MSLATETSTAEEKTVYSVCGLLQFSEHYAGQLIVSVLFLLLAFGQKLFSNTFSIDTQGMVGGCGRFLGDRTERFSYVQS